MLRAQWLVPFAVVACSGARPPSATEASPGVVFPMHLAEGHGDGAPAELPQPGASVAASGAPSAAPAPKPVISDPPDPTPLRQAEQYEYSFRYERGNVRLLGVRAVRYPQPIVTPRRVGRFAFELWIGRELVDRVRFDFPLLGADETTTGPAKLYAHPGMANGTFTTTVLVPAASRARSARLLDRATRTEAELPWPPTPSSMGALSAAPSASSASPSASSAAVPAGVSPSAAAPKSAPPGAASAKAPSPVSPPK